MNNKRIVYKQVYEILNTIDDPRIPEKIMVNLQKEMDHQYEFDIHKDEELLLEEAKSILSAIYTDYLATEEEREIILKLEEVYRQKEEQMKREKYGGDLFKKNNLQKQEDVRTEIIIQKEDSLMKKVIKWIKRVFKR